MPGGPETLHKPDSALEQWTDDDNEEEDDDGKEEEEEGNEGED